MKSAYEIALERTKHIQPAEDPYSLTPEQKKKVKELNEKYNVKIAEIETVFASRIRSMAETHGEQEVTAHMQEFSQELRAQKESVNSERAEELEKLIKTLKEQA